MKEAESTRFLQKKIATTQEKSDLLQDELRLDANLVEALKKIHSINELLEKAENAIDKNSALEASKYVKQGDNELPQLKALSSARCMDYLSDKLERLRNATSRIAIRSWDEVVKVDKNGHKIEIGSSPNRKLYFARFFTNLTTV